MPPSRKYSPLQGNPTGQNFEASLYGDVSANDQVSSFDGSLVLRISAQQDISPYYTHQPRDSIAADVSGNGAVSSFDASLIFRYSVGLIPRFPVDNAPSWLPKPAGPGTFTARLQLASTAADTFVYELLVTGEGSFYSSDGVLAFDPSSFGVLSLEPALVDSAIHFAVHRKPEKISFALASTRALQSEAPLIRLRLFGKRRDAAGTPPQILKLQVDESSATVLFTGEGTTGTVQFLGVSPNPFNAEVVFRFFIPADKSNVTAPEIRIYDVLGRQVRTIRPGLAQDGYVNVRWDGKNSSGRPVASGLYFARIRFGKNVKVAKVVCVR
ncbi:MAG TPA: T9SS type A sorting domain-containing protein [Bacteroidetes bacterium]|nr:T9SS type A sorting domain-containing protein [Bacteroidota bacterium]